MCTQSVGLLAGAVEAVGIRTVCLALVRDVARRVRPPRALAVPFPFGAALGLAGQPEIQHAVLRQAFALLEHPGPGPLLANFRP